jgi:hypothetical protein
MPKSAGRVPARYPFWGLIVLAIALRGDEPYSPTGGSAKRCRNRNARFERRGAIVLVSSGRDLRVSKPSITRHETGGSVGIASRCSVFRRNTAGPVQPALAKRTGGGRFSTRQIRRGGELRDTASFGDIHAENYIQHPAAAQAGSPEGNFRTISARMPDVEARVGDRIIRYDKNRRARPSATHTQPMQGIAPNRAASGTIDIGASERKRRHWDVVDYAGCWKQRAAIRGRLCGRQNAQRPSRHDRARRARVGSGARLRIDRGDSWPRRPGVDLPDDLSALHRLEQAACYRPLGHGRVGRRGASTR